ncbi:MAG TPA: glycosyltransferase [Opitutaceae bacterium]
MFTNTFAPLVGGLERSVANAHEDLTTLGHLSRVVTPAFKGSEDSSGGVLRLPAITGVGEKEFSIALTLSNRLDHWLEALEPDVLHSHQPFLLGETAWRMARRRRVPLVFTHHTLYERYAHYLLVGNERMRRLVISLTTHYANRCDLVIAPTESIRRLLLERGVTVPVEVAPSGIDLELCASGVRERGRAQLGLGAEDEVIGNLGRLSQEKNLGFLVEAAIRVVKRRSRAKCLLVGDGDRLAWAQARFAEEELAERLVTPGMMHGQAMADAYAAMDVFLFASHTDTQGLVLGEAMAAGLPVIALDAPGSRDCVIDGVSGWLLPANANEDAFAGRIQDMLDMSDRRERWAAPARRAADRFGREACVRRLLEIYETASANFRSEATADDDLWGQMAERLDVDWAPFLEKVIVAFRSLSGRSDDENTPS